MHEGLNKIYLILIEKISISLFSQKVWLTNIDYVSFRKLMTIFHEILCHPILASDNYVTLIRPERLVVVI